MWGCPGRGAEEPSGYGQDKVLRFTNLDVTERES